MKSKIIPLLTVILLASTYFIGTAYAVSQSDLDKANGDKSSINQQKQNAIKEQNEIKGQIANEKSELEAINEQLDTLHTEISDLQYKLDGLNASISDKQKEIEVKQKDLEEKQELLKKRLVAMYKNGGVKYLDVLLGSSSYMEMLASYDALEKIADADTKLINKVADEKKGLEDAKTELERQKAEVDSVKSQKEAKNTELTEKQTKKNRILSSLTEEERKLQVSIDNYEAQVRKIDDDIKKILEELNNKNNSSGGAGSNGLKFDGSFIWPCNNKIITSTVKRRWGRWHKGIDIGAYYENVYAAASGYAYNLENPGGYGHYVMVIHGDGYITLYGHLNAFRVSSGQYVKQGQVIAQSGNSGSSQGAHLHFEIRKASNISNFFSSAFLNPLDYLPGGYTFAPGAKTSS